MREALSFCRICLGHCGVVLTLDDNDRLTDIRADRDDPQTLGFACFKGLQAVETHNSDKRILKPLKRQPDGSFLPIALDQALDEIAAKLKTALDEGGPEAIAGFKGGGGFFTASAVHALSDFLKTVGSRKFFTTLTIDQSAKIVALGRLGIWPAGHPPFAEADVLMLIGNNPLVSISGANFDIRNPVKRLKDAKARGMKLIIIDPRYTETAHFADLFLQPLPGEDPTVVAGLIHIILAEGWHDQAFCAEHVGDLEALRQAVAPFTPDYVAARADVPKAKLWAAAELFARQGKRGPAGGATGPDMSPHSNLSEHLIGVLNVICGRYLREGEPVSNPGVLAPRYPRPAQVISAPRWWDQGPKSRIGGFGLIEGEMPTGIMADEILTEGEGRVRCIINHGGNPASSVPDQQRIVKAFKALDLLVSIEPFMTATARLSHYILPPKLQYERPDLPLFQFESMIYPEPYTRFTEAIAKPPAGSELVDDALIFWALAKRLGLVFDYQGTKLDMTAPPSIDALLTIAARHAPVSLEEIKRHPRGALMPVEPQKVTPKDPATAGKFSTMPGDVAEELTSVLAEYHGANGFSHRLSVRRHRDLMNSGGRPIATIRKRVTHNSAFINPEDMAQRGIASGDWIVIRSDHGAIRVLAQADPDLRKGVVSISHGFGGLPDEHNYIENGVSTNLLINGQLNRETINAMPRMSGIPVNIERTNL